MVRWRNWIAHLCWDKGYFYWDSNPRLKHFFGILHCVCDLFCMQQRQFQNSIFLINFISYLHFMSTGAFNDHTTRYYRYYSKLANSLV